MISVLRGMRDVFGQEINAWQHVERVFREVSERFGYQEFRTPIVEHTELFARGVGADTDIVGKEMYTFTDRSDESITLRPEMTAPIVRAAIEHSLLRHSPVTRLWYSGPLFRYERPQKGRYRQFHQYGAECLGSANPESDAECIILAYEVLATIGIKRFELQINSLGNAEVRKIYRETLISYLQSHKNDLSADSLRRLETNPLRVLDSKDAADQSVIKNAPLLIDFLDEASADHFLSVRTLLDVAGIPFTINSNLVRGLDYYTHTVFEFVTDALGTQNAICGGGRYDPLFEILGGTDVPAVGFSVGIERVIMLLEEEQGAAKPLNQLTVYICAAGDEARVPVQLVALRLRRNGISCVTDIARRSMKGQMKEADRLGAQFTATLGKEELDSGTILVKNMSTGEQRAIALEELASNLK